MALLLLIIIYVSFISLGLPDSLLGSAWPVMHLDLGVPLSAAGLISMIVTGGTVISSLLSGKLIARLGTGKLSFVSVLMTAAALLGFGISPSFGWLILCALPLGLGGGAIDAALNNFIALHYKARHMSWLHCFWGIGATLGPVIMSLFIGGDGAWRSGYRTIAAVQFTLTAILALTLPVWKRFEGMSQEESAGKKRAPGASALSIPGVKASLLCFFSYSAIELGCGLWGASFLVSRGISPGSAARAISLFYGGITLGRFISGFITMLMDNRLLIRLSHGICALGLMLLMLPLPVSANLGGLILIGLGCAPLFPAMLHETPRRFGPEASQTIMGIQMAAGYTGSTIIPPVLGLVFSRTAMGLLPFILCAFLITMALSSEFIERRRLRTRNGGGTGLKA